MLVLEWLNPNFDEARYAQYLKCAAALQTAHQWPKWIGCSWSAMKMAILMFPHDWQQKFQLMNFMAIKNIKQLHHFTFSSVNLWSVSCQVDTLAEEEVHRILRDIPDSATVNALTPVIHPVGLSPERQWYLYESISDRWFQNMHSRLFAHDQHVIGGLFHRHILKERLLSPVTQKMKSIGKGKQWQRRCQIQFLRSTWHLRKEGSKHAATARKQDMLTACCGVAFPVLEDELMKKLIYNRSAWWWLFFFSVSHGYCFVFHLYQCWPIQYYDLWLV